MTALRADRVGDRRHLVADVDDVGPALPVHLARADVDGRRADERPLADAAARVADQAGRPRHQPHVVVGLQVLEEVQPAVVAMLAEPPHAGGDVLRPGVRVRPQDDRGEAHLLDRLQRREDLLAARAVLGRHRDAATRAGTRRRCRTARRRRCRTDRPAAARGPARISATRSMRGQPTRWTCLRPLAETDDALARLLARRKVHVRELRHRVTDALVDRAADLPAHRVGQGDVHVGRGHRRRHRLEPIADRDDDVRPELIEDQRQLDESHPGGLHHRRGRLPFDEHVHAGATWKPSRSMCFTTAP